MEHRFPFQPAIVAMAAIAGVSLLCITILSGCEPPTQKKMAAMPLKGVHVVVADEFDGPAPWKPEAIGSMDYALASMIKARYNWGLAAAQDLTNALAKVTGCEVPLYFERDAPLTPGPVVYLGPVKAASAAGIDGADIMAGEWRITCDGKCAFIYARTTMGAAYGVTDFLARYADYHFVTIEGDDPYVVNPAASVPVVDFRAKHSVYARHYSVTTYLHSKPWLAGTGDMLPAYMRRTGCHVTPEIEGWVRPSLACGRHCHTFFSHLSPKDYFKEHPEYFSMDDTGKRVPRMLCLSNPDVKRIVTERIFSFIAKDRAENPENPPTLYDFSQEDSCGFLCRCPECKKLIAKYGGDSGLLLWFVNDLARTVRAKYPDVTIRTFAYVSTETVPVGIKPEPNIMFWLCDLYSKCDHELPLSHPLNARYHKLFKDWSAFAPKLEIWDYMLSDETFPEVSVDAIASDTRYFRDLGISRIYHQNPFGGQPLWELDTYVCSKLFRDPDADLEKAVDEYCAVYGKGARKMREAIDFLRDTIAKNPPESVDAWHQRALPWRKRAVMEKFRDLVRAAHDAEDAPRSRTRTALAMRCVSRELMRITNNEGDIAACEAAKRDFLAASEELGGMKLFAGVGKAKLMAYSTDEADLITFRFKRLPKGLENVPASEIHCLDVRSCPWIGGAAGGNKKVADPESECPKAVRVAPRSRDKLLSPVQVRECPVSWARKKEFAVKPVAGGGYRWYRVGIARIGRASDCYIQPAHISFAVGSRYIECDGMAEDPNWYEFWLSVKYNGDPFSTNEKEGLFVDRLLLRRVKNPHGLDGYSIVRPSALSETDAFVLKDVNGLLARSLGAELPVCGLDDAPAEKRIFFGIPPAGFPVAELANQEKVVVVKGGDVYLFGGGTNGTRYAAYDFLQNSLGFRFFDARGGVAVPDLHKAVLTDGVRRHRFAFEERECRHWVRCAGAESALFFFRHGMNLGIAGMMKRDGAGVAADDYCMPHPNCHSLTRNYLPRESIEDHPEYFSLRNGERIFNSQRCLSNSNVRQLLKKAFFEQLGRVKDPSYIDLSAGDTPWRFCECDGCAALERKYGTNGGPILDVFMEFCPEAARLYPRHRLMTLAYRRSQTQNPPTQVERMPDNFAVRFAPIEDDFSKDWNSPANADTLADLKRWCQVCRKVIMWYYPNPYGYGDMLTPPLGNVERLANDMKIMREAGVTGGTIQHDVGAAPMAGFTELQTYVIARLFDDVALDWRKLADEFIDFEYGAAADGIRKYLAELEHLRKETKTFFPWNAGLAHCDYLTPERLVRWGEAFDRMERMVADDRARLRNLRRLRINLDYAMLCSVNRVVAVFPDCAPSPKSLVDRIRAEADEILADCYAKQHAGRAEQFVKWLDEGLFLAEIQSVGNAKPLPTKLFGAVPKNRLFVTMPRSSAGGICDDKSAAYGKAAVYDAAGKLEATGLPFVANFGTRMPRSDRVLGIGRGVDTGNIAPSGEYRFYEMGTVELTRDCFVELGVRNLRATLNSAYVEGEYNKAKIYASLKFQGPAFYPADTNAQNRVWCDRVVVVRE